VKIKKLSHIGIAVTNLEESVRIFSKLLQIDKVETEQVNDQKVRVAFFRVGDSSIELTEATDPGSPIAQFIERRGEGIHHLSFEVDDIEAELARLKAAGFDLVDEKPRKGAGGYRIAFLHPKSTNGVLIEISEKARKL
jgi:methylmalonyl-CoA/ethylmalonyl-CoA epimerase